MAGVSQMKVELQARSLRVSQEGRQEITPVQLALVELSPGRLRAGG